jgi:hypothetical protein
LRAPGASARQDGDDRNGEWVLRDARAPRLLHGAARGGGAGRRCGRHGRPEWRSGTAGSVCPSRRPGDRGPTGLRRPAAVPARCRPRPGAAARFGWGSGPASARAGRRASAGRGAVGARRGPGGGCTCGRCRRYARVAPGRPCPGPRGAGRSISVPPVRGGNECARRRARPAHDQCPRDDAQRARGVATGACSGHMGGRPPARGRAAESDYGPERAACRRDERFRGRRSGRLAFRGPRRCRGVRRCGPARAAQPRASGSGGPEGRSYH